MVGKARVEFKSLVAEYGWSHTSQNPKKLAAPRPNVVFFA